MSVESLVACIALSIATGAPNDGDRFALARVELVGPLREVRAEVDAFARAEWLSPLAEGERVVVSLAFPVRAGSDAVSPPQFELDGAGRATFVEWLPTSADARSRAWLSFPSSLRNRPRPTPGRQSNPRIPPTAWWLAAATGVVVLALRRKPSRALAVAIVGGCCAAYGQFGGERRSPITRVFEIDGLSRRVVAVDFARDSLEVSAQDLRWEAAPERAELVARQRGSATREPTIELAGEAVDLRVWRELAVDDLSLSPDGNRWGALGPVWMRGADGAWREAPAWPVDSPPPHAGDPDSVGAESSPPGWLNPALPLGQRVIVGRWRDADREREGAASEVWVRWVGP